MKIKCIVSALVALCVISVTSYAGCRVENKYFTDDICKKKIVDDGGTGDYKAEAITEQSLKNVVVYRPCDIKYASRTEGKLPVLIFSNGDLSDTSVTYERVLNEIASHGYIVIALGDMQMRFDERMVKKAPDDMIFEALDWIILQNSDPNSDYYHLVDVDNVAVGGQSRGGAQVVNTAYDERFKTYLMYNTGIGDMEMDGVTKKKLKNFHAPVLYVLGDDEDIAYSNALKDYDRISNVPVAFANFKDEGHMGTFSEKNGGTFAKLSVQWLDWQLKRRVSNSEVFLNGRLDEYTGWTIKNKKFTRIYNITEFDVEELSCVNSGKRIWGQIFVPKGVDKKVPLVIIGHGYNSSFRETQSYAEALAQHGVASCIFDFCGGSMNSRSEGKTTDMSVFTEQSDMEAIMNESKNWKFVDQNKIVIMGCSQGGLVASITAAANADRVNSLILIYPALGIGEDAINNHPKEAIHSDKFNLMGLEISHVFYDKLLNYSVFEDVKKFHKPVTEIYGDQDPIAENDNVEKARASFERFENHVISGGRHGFPNKKHLDKAIAYTLDFVGLNVL